MRIKKTAIKHVHCGGIVEEIPRWGRPMYRCPKCGRKSKNLASFAVSPDVRRSWGSRDDDDS